MTLRDINIIKMYAFLKLLIFVTATNALQRYYESATKQQVPHEICNILKIISIFTLLSRSKYELKYRNYFTTLKYNSNFKQLLNLCSLIGQVDP